MGNRVRIGNLYTVLYKFNSRGHKDRGIVTQQLWHDKYPFKLMDH